MPEHTIPHYTILYYTIPHKISSVKESETRDLDTQVMEVRIRSCSTDTTGLAEPDTTKADSDFWTARPAKSKVGVFVCNKL